MSSIHQFSCVEDGAVIADDVVIGPYCYIQKGVKLGAGCILESHVTILSGTEIGERCKFSQGAIIGGTPQDLKYKGEESFLKIGSDNVIREYVTIHRGSGEGTSTTIGDNNFIMAFVHIGHNCHIGTGVTITNNCGLSGHVTVEDGVVIGGMVGVHQFVRIGQFAMIGGMSRIVRDAPPYMQSGGMEQQVYDINAVGLRRRGISQEARQALHKACKLLFKSQIAVSTAIEFVQREVPQTPEVEYLLNFVERSRLGKNGRGDQK